MPGAAHNGVFLTAMICVAEVLTLVGVFTFPALLPVFFDEWGLSNTEAGWIAGIYFGANAAVVGVLVSLTDRVDARLIYLFGAALAAIGSAGFALFAEGFWTALVFRAMAGMGLAGTYMPGLRALTDRYDGRHQARAVAFYTGTFSLGTATSFLVAGQVARAFGWRWSFAVAAIAAALALVIVAVVLRPARPQAAKEETRLLDTRPVLANRRAMAYILAYGAHTWELTSLRSWTVAFLAFALTLGGDEAGWLAPTTVAMLSAIIAMFSSIAGAELATRFGFRRWVMGVMVCSAVTGAALGFSAGLPYLAVVALLWFFAVLVQADAGVINSGTLGAAEAGRRGLTLAVHSTFGFVCAFLAPLVFGVVLDLAGGGTSPLAWGLAFAAIGAGVLLGPLALAVLAGGAERRETHP
ncbi:MAG: MFS transporter [Rhodospirillales bacterium]|jgi:predicted MFS family arabinose efflux permease|nr:MFS transporter [Rhodospirillales bacterium]